MFKVSASAPTRVDLGGGTLDITPLHHLLKHKATINFSVTLNASVHAETIDKGKFRLHSKDQNLSASGTYAEITQQSTLPLFGALIGALWTKDLPGIDLTTAARSPAGAGLGGSSALGIAMAGALCQLRHRVDGTPLKSRSELVQVVQDVEISIIHAPTGCQDYWGAVNGGISIIRFPPGGPVVTQRTLLELPQINNGLILVFSGKSRASATNNWQIFRRAFEGDKQVLSLLNQIGVVAEQLADAVLDGKSEQIFALSQAEWQLRKQLWPDIETVETQAIDAAARAAGARFTRVCGAGGGGVMAVFAPDVDTEKMLRALRAAGGEPLDGVATDSGLQVHDLSL